MPGIVTLAVTEGPLAGKTFAFEQHDTFLFGRAGDCHAVLSPDDVTASRQHFLLEVNPPDARLRDLGSRNGTWVNDVKYGGRADKETPEDAARRCFPEVDIQDGDRAESRPQALTEALALFEDADRRLPDDPVLLYNWASTLVKARRAGEAAQIAIRLQSLTPDDPDLEILLRDIRQGGRHA